MDGKGDEVGSGDEEEDEVPPSEVVFFFTDKSR